MASYLTKIASGAQYLYRAITTSAGVADADKIPATNASGVLDISITNGTIASAGAGSSGKLVALDASGRIDSSAMPVGVGADSQSFTTSEAIAAGDIVNLHNSSGPKARRADASNGRPGHGFAPSGAASGASVVVYFEGTNSQVAASRTPGAQQFLSATTPGAVTETAPTTAGQFVQALGFATGATSLSFEAEEPTYLT